MRFSGYILSLGLIFSSNAGAATGVLILAHGTHCGHDDGGGHCPPDPSPWEQAVLDTVATIANRIPAPVEVAFGMWETANYDRGITTLDERLGGSLDRLIVIPLFISRHSIVIDMQRYIFRQTNTQPAPIPAAQVRFSGRIEYGATIDHDPIVAAIVATRAESLVNKAGVAGPATELVIAMHGPVEDHEDHLWRVMGHQYAADITAARTAEQRFAEIHVVSLRDDAEAPVRDRAAQILRDAVSGATTRGHKALVLPLLVAPGGIEKGIHERLQGLEYVWTGETLLPDARIGAYLEARILPYLQ